MKILIIGSKGMLGQTLMEVFGSSSEVIGWDRDEVDLVEIKNQKSKIKNLEADLVVNAAAYNDVDRAEQEPEIAGAVNGYAVGNLAKICKELDIPLVHYSSDYVFDGVKKEGYVEADKPNPISAYGYSKFLGEQELQKNTDKFYLIRLSRLFGSEAQVIGAKKSFASKMLELAQKQKEIEVIDEELSCPTYAPDLAQKTREIVEAKLPFGIYHCPNSGNAVTWYGFAAEIFKIAVINVKLIPVPAERFPRPAKRPAFSVLLNTKLPPQRPWLEALQEYLSSYKP
ncbi:MAG: dTDP-4-dehydrorhamnose reductase [Candidatus Doudnabacteria bacterium]|nr:dTDP-4-dehydrorhamnose reductase [Candidatus Doudnabacteria bacterium]